MTQPHEPIRDRYPDLQRKRTFVRDLFDRGAPYYDRIGKVGFLGTGHFYRKRALRSNGLRPGMRVLDVACGTGAVTRAIVEVLEGEGTVCGIDPSEGMLAQARAAIPADFVQGYAERLPYGDSKFDYLTLGYALRHVEDLEATFREFRRVLKPGGQLLLLEITRPQSRLGQGLARAYFGGLLPGLSRLVTGSAAAQEMMAYYWETIVACVPPEIILEALREVGFEEVGRHVEIGVFSEYRARNP